MKKELIKEENKNWQKIFYTISLGQAFSILGSSIVQFAIVWYLTVSTNSAIVLTIATMVSFLPQAILGPFIGTIVDKSKRKYVMIYADLSIALVTLALLFLFMNQKESLGMIYLVLAIRSIGTCFHMPAMQASIPMIVPEDKLSLAASITQFIQSVSNIAAPALGALIFAKYSIEYILIIDIVGAIIAVTTLLCVKIPNPAKIQDDANSEGMIQEMIYGFKELRKNRGIYSLTIILAINTIIFMPIASLFPLMVSNHFNGGAYESGFVEITFAIGLLVGSILLGIIGEKYKKSNIISLAMLISGIALTVSGMLPTNYLVVFALMSMIMGLAGPLIGGTHYVLLQSKIEPSILGRVISISNSMMFLAIPIGLLVAGPVSQIIGIDKWFLISGILTVIIGLVCKFNGDVSKIEK
ncbi:MFS transporter [Clostridium sp.]|uniref:MFS transporter n=1 Tax=Clostridium sp. TaxID=1506 RepID=UPI003F389991